MSMKHGRYSKNDIESIHSFLLRYLIKATAAFVTMLLFLSGLGIVYNYTSSKVTLQNNPYTYIPGNANDIWRGTYGNISIIVFFGDNYFGAIVYGQNLILENSKIFKIFRVQLYLREPLICFNVPVISVPKNSSFSFIGFNILAKLFGQNISLNSSGSEYIANPESSIMIFGNLAAIKASLTSSYYGTFINQSKLLPIQNDNFLSFEYIHSPFQPICSATGNISHSSVQIYLYLNPIINSFDIFILIGYILPSNATIFPLPNNGVLITVENGNSLYEFIYANFNLFLDSVI